MTSVAAQCLALQPSQPAAPPDHPKQLAGSTAAPLPRVTAQRLVNVRVSGAQAALRVQEIMTDPVLLLSDERSYESSALLAYLAEGNNTSPATGELLTSKDYLTNHTLRRMMSLL